MDCRDTAKESEYSEDPLSAKQGTFFLKSICKDDIDQEYDGEDGSCDADCLVGHPAAQLSKQGLQDVKEDHAANPKANTRIQSDPALKIEGIVPVVPQPIALKDFHNIAAKQLQSGGQDNNAEEHQNWGNRKAPQPNGSLLEPPQSEKQQKSAYPIDDAVGAQENPTVRKAPAIDHNFQKYFIDPAEYRVEHKEEKIPGKKRFTTNFHSGRTP